MWTIYSIHANGTSMFMLDAGWLLRSMSSVVTKMTTSGDDSLRFPLPHCPISYNLSTLMFIKPKLFSHTPGPMSCHMIEKPSNEMRCFREFNRFIGLELCDCPLQSRCSMLCQWDARYTYSRWQHHFSPAQLRAATQSSEGPTSLM